MYSKGISWIDDCRIPFVDGDKTVNHNTVPGSFVGSIGYSEKIYHENTIGRFPANILVSDDILNDGVISKSGSNRKNTKYKPLITQSVKLGGGNKDSEPKDKGSNSRYYDIDKWFDKILE